MKRIKANQIANGYLSEGIDEGINPEYFIADEAQAKIDELVEILNLYITRDGDDVYPWTNKAKELAKHKGE